MKQFTRFFAFLALLIFMAALIGCDNPSSSEDSPKIITEFDEGVTVWEGNIKFLNNETDGWYSEPWGFLHIPFHNVKEGDQILITHSSLSSDEPHVFQFQGYGWGDLLKLDGIPTNATVGTWGDDNRSYLQPYTANQTTAITLSAADADIINGANPWNGLNCGGISLCGNGFTVKKIEVVSDSVTGAVADNLLEGKVYSAESGNMDGEEMPENFPLKLSFLSISAFTFKAEGTPMDARGMYVIEGDTIRLIFMEGAYGTLEGTISSDKSRIEVSGNLRDTNEEESNVSVVFKLNSGTSTNDTPIVTSLTGTYRGSLTGNGETLHMRMTFNSNGTFVTQGYTNRTFTATSNVGTASGSYTLSGNTATCTVTVGDENFVVYATTSDNWASVICSGLYEGTMTKE